MLWKYKNTIKSCLLLLVIGACLSACKNKNEDVPQTAPFDRQKMLRNYAMMIKSRFLNRHLDAEQLQVFTRTFVNQPTVQNLEAVQIHWKFTYRGFQDVNSFNVGPAGEQGTTKRLVEEISTFPISIAKIESTIQSGQLNFSSSDRDARGLLAVEYLLFAEEPAETIRLFADQKRKDYLMAAVDNIKSWVTQVLVDWNTYTTEFVANDGTEAGSSTSVLYNEFVRNFEALANLKVGLPLGKCPGQTQAEPARMEAFYSGLALDGISGNFSALKSFYYGESYDGRRGASFKTYLESLEGGRALSASIEAQWQAIEKARNAIPIYVPLPKTLDRDPALVEALHTELQKNVRFFKNDVSSVLGIAITFDGGECE